MLDILRSLFSGRDSVVAVPAMDGPFKPNNRLEEAERVLSVPGVDSVAAGDALYCSAGSVLYRITPDGQNATLVEAQTFDAPIAFVAAAPDGRTAVGVSGVGVRLFSRDAGWSALPLPAPLSACMTAAAFLPDGKLALCIGSTRNPASQWKRDLMENGASGAVLAIDLTDGSFREIASGLAFPNGALPRAGRRILVAESWRHRLVETSMDSGSPTQTALDELPAYPARMARASDGGFWLTCFAPRRQLFELLLKEDDYRSAMTASIDPDEWIGPDLSQDKSPTQPLQQGAVRQMGILKPWAPSRSYGLVVRCDANAVPLQSWHSRADGRLHGVTSAAEWDGDLWFVSRGAGVLGRFPAAREEQP